MSNDPAVSFEEAFSRLGDGLLNNQTVKVGSFWEFLRDVWSQSFDHPEYFKAWHVGILAEDIERCIEDKMNYVAILPRFHFKSTVLGHAFSVWRLLKSSRDSSVLYLSFSDQMARYHIAEINKTVNRNPQIQEWMKNRAPKADYSFRYMVQNKPVEIMHGGLFSFKRGMHVNGALIADDVLRDPENPLNVSQIKKVEEQFLTESMFIPLQGVPVIVLGTPMMPGDLLTKLQEDERFRSRILPALDPVPGRRVLMPELYSEKWLLTQQKARPKSFASEFLLVPHFNTESYFNEEDILKVEDENLLNHPLSRTYEPVFGEELFAGFDIGEKRHPSHLAIFRKVGGYLEQIHESWLDGWSYSDQIDFLNEAAEHFGIRRGYIDNTRGELEDRGLDRIWEAMVFSTRTKNNMAQVFEKYVHSGQFKMLKSERQRQQILSVSNDLKAPETPLGHGDSFFSVAMALYAAYESSRYAVTNLGNLMDWWGDFEEEMDKSPTTSMEKRWNPSKKELTNEEEESTIDSLASEAGTTPDFTSIDSLLAQRANAPNPACEEPACQPALWVPSRNLCLYCRFRG